MYNEEKRNLRAMRVTVPELSEAECPNIHGGWVTSPTAHSLAHISAPATSYKLKSPLVFFLGGGTPRGAQGLLLLLGSGLIPGDTQQTIQSTR